jgi:phosphatidylinositol-bisphosphatase/inositol-1,4,5-trisphosphate 5-phosphatase
VSISHKAIEGFSEFIKRQYLIFEYFAVETVMVLRIDGQKPDNISMLAEDSANSIYPQESVSIVAVTWNLFASVPPINSLVQLSRSSSFSPAPDLIFVGTQECERSLLVSFCCEAKREWEAMLAEVFGEYTLAATQVMRGLHTAVLIRNKLRNYFSVEREGRVKAGACGVMGNKGAISLEVAVLGQTFQLVNCHLAPHQSGTAVRNDTITRILGELVRKDLQCEVIFLGDFNYRIEMSK